MILKNTLLDYWREIHHKAGYVEISTPQIMNQQLWMTSGHWDHYKDNMYTTVIDDEEYCIKPMNCPGGVLVYSSKPHSYRELPIRAGEIGLVHRHELKGALHGLFRVRCFNQDDAHLFVTPEQLTDEIVGVVRLIDSVYQKFGFKYMNQQLWMTSGHWDHYKDNMYTTVIDDEEYCIKPMNCPGGVLVYSSKPHSYRELPIRAGEIGLVHRHELKGALHGLFRVRCFNQDDAHLFVTPEQLTDEIVGVVRLIDSVYQKFGFKYHVELSTRPEDSMGSDEDWAAAEEGLKVALGQLGMD